MHSDDPTTDDPTTDDLPANPDLPFEDADEFPNSQGGPDRKLFPDDEHRAEPEDDPDSPGAGIDRPSPPEPNEPG
jgi:hypothetical protein